MSTPTWWQKQRLYRLNKQTTSTTLYASLGVVIVATHGRHTLVLIAGRSEKKSDISDVNPFCVHETTRRLTVQILSQRLFIFVSAAIVH